MIKTVQWLGKLSNHTVSDALPAESTIMYHNLTVTSRRRRVGPSAETSSSSDAAGLPRHFKRPTVMSEITTGPIPETPRPRKELVTNLPPATSVVDTTAQIGRRRHTDVAEYEYSSASTTGGVNCRS